MLTEIRKGGCAMGKDIAQSPVPPSFAASSQGVGSAISFQDLGAGRTYLPEHLLEIKIGVAVVQLNEAE
jgi:hypothetical protein